MKSPAFPAQYLNLLNADNCYGLTKLEYAAIEMAKAHRMNPFYIEATTVVIAKLGIDDAKEIFKQLEAEE